MISQYKWLPPSISDNLQNFSLLGTGEAFAAAVSAPCSFACNQDGTRFDVLVESVLVFKPSSPPCPSGWPALMPARFGFEGHTMINSRLRGLSKANPTWPDCGS